MGNRDVILGFLLKIAPNSATNSEILARTGIKPHQQVFQITRRLVNEGQITRQKIGKEWSFSASRVKKPTGIQVKNTLTKKRKKSKQGTLSPSQFEKLAQKVLSAHLGKALVPRQVPGVHKKFDLVSSDLTIVGDAKYFTLVRGSFLPPAKFSIIAEHVWLLEKTRAKQTFLVFGNDRQVPKLWLKRYGPLLSGVHFFFLEDGGSLSSLT